VVFLLFIRSIRLIGIEKTEGTAGVAAEPQLESHMCHMRAYPAARYDRTRADGLMGTVKTQTRDAVTKMGYLSRHFRFFAIKLHTLNLFEIAVRSVCIRL
jgi:hypothetical protein